MSTDAQAESMGHGGDGTAGGTVASVSRDRSAPYKSHDLPPRLREPRHGAVEWPPPPTTVLQALARGWRRWVRVRLAVPEPTAGAACTVGLRLGGGPASGKPGWVSRTVVAVSAWLPWRATSGQAARRPRGDARARPWLPVGAGRVTSAVGGYPATYRPRPTRCTSPSAPHPQARIGQAPRHAQAVAHLRRRQPLRMVLEQGHDAPPHGAARVAWRRLGGAGVWWTRGRGRRRSWGILGGFRGPGCGAGRGGAGSAGGHGRAWRSSGRYAPGNPAPALRPPVRAPGRR